MPVRFPCPKCRNKVEISSKVPFGTPVRCPSCAQVFPNPSKTAAQQAAVASGGPASAVYHKQRGRHRSRGASPQKLAATAAAIVGLLLLVGGGAWLVTKFGGAADPNAVAATTGPATPPTEKTPPETPPPEKTPPEKTPPEKTPPVKPPEKTPPEKPPPEKPPPEKPPPVKPPEKTPPEKTPPDKPPDKPPPDKPVVLSADEKKLFDLVNTYRKEQKKLPPLQANAKLMDVARKHVATLEKRKPLPEDELDDIDGKNTCSRLKDAGYKFKMVKNEPMVAVIPDFDANLQPEQAFARWINNDLAKSFILGDYEETGIGIVRSETGKVYYCQIYAAPDK